MKEGEVKVGLLISNRSAKQMFPDMSDLLYVHPDEAVMFEAVDGNAVILTKEEIEAALAARRAGVEDVEADDASEENKIMEE